MGLIARLLDKIFEYILEAMRLNKQGKTPLYRDYTGFASILTETFMGKKVCGNAYSEAKQSGIE